MNFTTNYIVRPVSEKPEKDDYYLIFFKGRFMGRSGFYNGKWINEDVTPSWSWLEPVESVCLTRGEVEKMLREAWEAAISREQEEIECTFDKHASKWKHPDKLSFIKSILSPDKNNEDGK